jgi:hypothetical protein
VSHPPYRIATHRRDSDAGLVGMLFFALLSMVVILAVFSMYEAPPQTGVGHIAPVPTVVTQAYVTGGN